MGTGKSQVKEMVMTTVLRRGMPGMTGEGGSMARRLTGAGVLAGLPGGLAMIVVMILVTGAAGMGYATPLNVGMASFAFTIAPPASMLPTLMPMMGIHLPASVAPQVMAAAASGHISPALISRLQPMLMGMHLPAATVTQIGALMSGHATNAQVAGLMSMLPPSAELSQVFARFGARVTVIEAQPRLLPATEPEAGDLLAAVFDREGIDVRTGTPAARVSHDGRRFTVSLDGEAVTAERLLVLAIHAQVPLSNLKTMIYAYPTFHRAIQDAVNELDKVSPA
jgi:Pyridine nucleotide-disulphide oxidoreductase